MRKPKFNPDYPTVPILIFVVITSLIALAVGINGISYLREALATGRVYGFGIMFDDETIISSSSSPGSYWVMIAIYIVAVVGGIGLGVPTAVLIVIAYIKKLARQKMKRAKE